MIVNCDSWGYFFFEDKTIIVSYPSRVVIVPNTHFRFIPSSESKVKQAYEALKNYNLL